MTKIHWVLVNVSFRKKIGDWRKNLYRFKFILVAGGEDDDSDDDSDDDDSDEDAPGPGVGGFVGDVLGI